MNYELAKKLEAVGLTWDDDYPTISELIEAMGIEFYSLTYTIPKTKLLPNIWHCIGTPIYPRVRREIDVTGSTPEEAVANLYLALHSK